MHVCKCVTQEDRVMTDELSIFYSSLFITIFSLSPVRPLRRCHLHSSLVPDRLCSLKDLSRRGASAIKFKSLLNCLKKYLFIKIEVWLFEEVPHQSQEMTPWLNKIERVDHEVAADNGVEVVGFGRGRTMRSIDLGIRLGFQVSTCFSFWSFFSASA